MFEGNINSQVKENHVFLSNDPIMEDIGLASFSTKSFKEIVAKNYDGIVLVYPTLAEFLDNVINDSLIDLVEPQEGKYRTLDIGSGKYVEQKISVSETKDLIEYHEKISKTPSDQLKDNKDDAKDKQIADIQNSLTNSIVFELLKSIFKITDDANPYIRIKLFFTKATKKSNKRIMAQRGAPMIVDTPRRSTNGPYGFQPTRERQQNTDASANNIGQYEDPSLDGEDDMTNLVGAPLKISYNATTRMWESGTTQILAKLTEDVPAADIKSVKISPADIEGLTGSDVFYQPDSDFYMGGHTSTLAIPLSLENGNPNLFGPNLLSCKNGQCERVRAVNRAPRSFSAGSVVLLSNIDGEWIIQDFGANPEDLKPAATSFGEWSFTKLIASSDNYFKDERFALDDIESLSDEIKSKVKQTVSPSEYEYQSRLQFFYSFYVQSVSEPRNIYKELNLSDLKEIVHLNLDTTTIDELFGKELWFYPSRRYLVATAFDQIGRKFGGFSSATYISKTNISTGDFPNFNGYPQAVEVPFFWGPVFTQGYKKLTFDTTDLFQKNQNEYFSVLFSSSDPPLPASHMPAELTSKIIDTLDIIENWGKLGTQTIVQTHIKTPGYNSKKNSLNEIQFSPLYADMAAHDDPVSRIAKDVVRQYYINSRIIAANNILGLNITSTNDFPDENMWGYMYLRNQQRGLLQYTEASQELFDAIQQNCGAYELNNAASLGAWVDTPFISYDCFIKQFPTNIPTGAPDEFRDTNSKSIGANLVGVIAGKQTISKRRGGKIDFTCKQYFGLPQKRTVSGSTGGISILPIGGVGVVIGANPPGINQNAFPQWGSSLNDRYDSFGTTALHVRIFDYWPEENTIFDPRYYGVLHFNPGELFSEVTVEEKGLSTEDIQNKYGSQYSFDNLPPNISYADIPRQVSQTTGVTNSIDIRIPTYGVEFLNNASPSTSSDGYTIPVGTLINNDTKPLRPNNEWNISTIRRGQMLTEGGFHYLYRAIGLSNHYDIVKKGKGFEVGQQLTLAGSRAVEIEITKVDDGGIEEFKFISTKNLRDENGRGVNFLPSDFSSNPTTEDVTLKCYKLTIPAPPEGESASIEFYNGIVYMRHGLDIGPVEHVPPKLISSSSKAGLGSGKGPVDETKTSDVTLGENTSGQYDCFYFFHNDITHTPMRAFTFSPGFAQHITLTIS